MAWILNPTLSITLRGADPKGKQRGALLTVTCQVSFSQIEQCMMKVCDQGAWYWLEAYCYGEDNPTNHAADQVLFLISKIGFPGGDPNNVTFTLPIPWASNLDEDPGPAPPDAPTWPPPPPGQDEIYVRLKLLNVFSQTYVAEADTNVVQSVFSW